MSTRSPSSPLFHFFYPSKLSFSALPLPWGELRLLQVGRDEGLARGVGRKLGEKQEEGEVSRSVGRSVGFGKGIAKSWFASGRRIHSGESRRDGITNERVAPDCKIEFELAALWEWIWDEDEDWNQFGYGNFRRTFSYLLSSRFSDFKISRETLMITQLSRLIPDFFFFKFWFFVFFFFKSRWSCAGSVRIILRTKSKTNNYLQRRRLFLI